MTVWELKKLCLEKIKNKTLTEQQRGAWRNALQSAEIQIEIMTPKQLSLFGGDNG